MELITWTMYTTQCEPAKYLKLISWINVMSRQCKELALWPHSDWMLNWWICVISVSWLHMEDQKSQLTFQHFLKKRNRMSGKTVQRHRKIYNKLVHIEQVIGLGKTFKILTLALNRTEAKLASDISFVVVQFRTMHYSAI